METWDLFKRNISTQIESEVHPHVENEKAYLFVSKDINSTEIEYLDLLFGLIRTLKPANIIETGSCGGIGAVAMAFALKDNLNSGANYGHLHTLEICVENHSSSMNLVNELGLDGFVTQYFGRSLDTIATFPNDFQADFVYFDSSRPDRIREFHALNKGGHLSEGAVVAFHDTSRMRSKSNQIETVRQNNYISELDDIANQCINEFEFHLSRGLRIFRVS